MCASGRARVSEAFFASSAHAHQPHLPGFVVHVEESGTVDALPLRCRSYFRKSFCLPSSRQAVEISVVGSESCQAACFEDLFQYSGPKHVFGISLTLHLSRSPPSTLSLPVIICEDSLVAGSRKDSRCACKGARNRCCGCCIVCAVAACTVIILDFPVALQLRQCDVHGVILL